MLAPFALEVLKKYTKVSDPEMLEQTYALTRAVIEDPPLRLDPRGIQAVLDFLPSPKAKAARPDDFMDLRLLNEVEQAGFFKTIR